MSDDRTSTPHPEMPFQLCDTQCMEPKRRQELLEQAVTWLWFHVPAPPTPDDRMVVRKLEDATETHRFWAEVHAIVRKHWGKGHSLNDVIESTRGE